MALEVDRVSAWYGQARALRDVSIVVPNGAVIGLFGHNGAGKSTLLRCIARHHPNVRGMIRHDGEDITGLLPHTVARRGVLLVREGARAFESLTVQDHLALGLRLRRQLKREPMTVADVLATFQTLEPLRQRAAAYLSGGQRQLLVLAAAFAAGPSTLLLDEPSTGLSPSVARLVFEAIGDLAARGVSLLVAEQNERWLGEICTDGYRLETGSLIAHIGSGAVAGAGWIEQERR